MVKKIKSVHVLELNEAYHKVMQWFFSYPLVEIGLTDLSEALGISKTTAKRVVLALQKEQFLKISTIGKLWRISCNQHHHYNFSRKIAHNLILIYESGILDSIHEAVQNSRSIILFGSYRKGDDIETSDVDIAVEVVSDEGVKIFALGVIPQLGYRKNISVNLHVFSRNKIDLNLFANIANGIVLEGFLEVRP